jgi:hypothetical protein
MSEVQKQNQVAVKQSPVKERDDFLNRLVWNYFGWVRKMFVEYEKYLHFLDNMYDTTTYDALVSEIEERFTVEELVEISKEIKQMMNVVNRKRNLKVEIKNEEDIRKMIENMKL